MTHIPTITLNDGHTIPQLGFGVFQIPPAETEAATRTALDTGYRHIDTAEMYGNEPEVGAAIRASDLDRGEVFLTTKLNNGFHEAGDARRAFAQSLEDLGVDHIDLFLIHWPLPTLYDGDYLGTWRVLEEFKVDGRARSIGVSNFQVEHLQRLLDEANIAPAVNQIELHPYFQNDEVRTFGEANGIATEAWSPIAQGDVLDDPVVTEIAEAVGRTPAQVVLRWHIQRRTIVFPKSVTPARMAENLDLFDFDLEGSQMAAIGDLDRAESGRRGPNPETFAGMPGR